MARSRLRSGLRARELAETYFWEAACHALGEKLELARSLYAKFLENAAIGRGQRQDLAKRHELLRQSWKTFFAGQDAR